ncbi:MAG: hypothetical protein RLZ44_602 [Pseudomonadota bacterium]
MLHPSLPSPLRRPLCSTLMLLALAPMLAVPGAAASGWEPAPIGPGNAFQGYVGPEACRECHAGHVEQAPDTAHFQASSLASAQTIQGSFTPEHNRLATRDPQKELVMHADADGSLEQRLVLRVGDRDVTLRAAEFAIVLGAVKGQTYLYWRHDLLCQLPASYTKGGDAWAYSPGYPEGVPYFDRVIKPDCVECHTTVFETLLPDRVVKTDQAILGVTCEACHGPGEAHVQHHRAHPDAATAAHMTAIGALSREQQVEACGYCHSGVKPDSHKRPAFTFRAGDRLADYFELQPADTEFTPEVHGNQMGLLQQSRCYQDSPSLVCTTCHDPHREQRGQLQAFAARCQGCHADLAGHPQVAAGADLQDDCVHCHMPLIDSKLIDVTGAGQKHHFAVRSHRIGIYRE